MADKLSCDNEYRDLELLTQLATEEINRVFVNKGLTIPKIVFAINRDGKIIAFQPNGVALVKITFPREVGNLIEPTKLITLTHVSRSPDETVTCWIDPSGKEVCY